MSGLTAGTAARAVPLRSPASSPDATPDPTPAQEGGPQRWLRLVPQRRSSAARAPFAVVLVVVLGGGLLGLLLLNTLVAQDSFALHRLATESRELQQREQMLASRLEAQQAPAALAEQARRLGMVPGGAPVFLRLSDGKVLGRAKPGAAAPAVRTSPKPEAATTAAGVGSAPSSTKAAPAARPGTAPRSAPEGSTTWTAPRQTPPPTNDGTRR